MKMHVVLTVSEEERALIRQAAAQPGWSVSAWATTSLVDLARVETSWAAPSSPEQEGQ